MAGPKWELGKPAGGDGRPVDGDRENISSVRGCVYL